MSQNVTFVKKKSAENVKFQGAFIRSMPAHPGMTFVYAGQRIVLGFYLLMQFW